MSSGRSDSDHEPTVCLLRAGSLPVDLTESLHERGFTVEQHALAVGSDSGSEAGRCFARLATGAEPPAAIVLVTNDPSVLEDAQLGAFDPVVVATSDRQVERAVHTGTYPVSGVCRVTDDSAAATLAWVVDSAIEVHEFEVQTERLRVDTALVRDVNTGIVRATSRGEVESTVCDRLVGTRYTLAWIASTHEDPVEVRAIAGRTGSTTDASSLAESVDGEGPLAAALATHKIQVAWDEPLAERYRPDGVDGPFGVAVAPLVYEDRCFGALVVHSETREGIDEQAQALLTDVAENAAHAIQAARDRETVRLSRNRLEAITGAIPDLVIVYDEDARYEEVLTNEPVLGLENPNVLLGRTAHEILPHEAADSVLGAVRDTIETGEGQTIEYTVPFEGDTFVWEARTTLLERAADGAGRVVFLARDVTERHEYQAELEAKNERLDEFASFVSHDLRNPLNVAQATLEMVEAADEDSGTYLAEARLALDRMTDLIEDVLALARQGAVVEDPTRTALEPVVHRAWASVDSGDAKLDVGPDLGRVLADPDRLQQLFENLFRNSVEHGSPGDGPVTVHVSRTPTGFRVVDDGPGIPPENREQVLEHGFTTHDSGTGFGLAIVDRIVSAHGWTVAVVDPPEPDLGACFEIAGVEFV
ncbi:ATP-binding protein [Haloarchaeobius baliensis]|uniref:sensor histidine kinase n=1 Tax=Haloarchaeobius baliensis TaxID=1670458 RepID=UPI003F885471